MITPRTVSREFYGAANGLHAAMLQENYQEIELFFKELKRLRTLGVTHFSASELIKIFNEKDDHGKTILHRVVENYQEDWRDKKKTLLKLSVMEKILICGGSLWGVDNAGRTSLHSAGFHGQIVSVQFLYCRCKKYFPQRFIEYLGKPDNEEQTFFHVLTCYCDDETIFRCLGLFRDDFLKYDARSILDVLEKPDKRVFTVCDYAHRFEKRRANEFFTAIINHLCEVIKSQERRSLSYDRKK